MENNITKYKLSDEAVVFIRDYLFAECEITAPIDENKMEEFISIAFDWETSMVDENGNDKLHDYPDKRRNEAADRFISEVSNKWVDEFCFIDFSDLNQRLGLQ